MVGITVFLDGDTAPGDTFIQVADGESLAMPVEVFRKELDGRGAFYDVIGRFAQALQILSMQSVACNTFHTVEERCARWLLMTHDRMAVDDLPLTHEFLSYMLGVRRPTVSRAGHAHQGWSHPERHEAHQHREPGTIGADLVRVL